MSEFIVRDVDTQDPLWVSVLENIEHDIYHLPSYVAVSSLNEGGDPRALVVTDQSGQLMLLPYVRRPINEELWDAISPYGYAGPITSSGVSPQRRIELLDAALNHLMLAGCVTIFLRSHPGLNLEWPTANVGYEKLRLTSPTVVLDLRQDPDFLWMQFRPGHRYEMTRAERLGYKTLVDRDGQYLSQFAGAYRENMSDSEASNYYFFSDDYFAKLRDALGERFVLLIALDSEDAFAAGAVFTVEGDWVQYHLACTDRAHKRLSPSKLIVNQMRLRAANDSRLWLHLGGGRGGSEDSLLKFKQGFSPLQRTFYASGIVLNAPEYERLQITQVASGVEDFFPAYRHP